MWLKKWVMKKSTRFNCNWSSQKIVLLGLATLCLTSLVSPPLALLLGIVYAQVFKHPFPETSKRATGWLLKASVVGLGFGMTATSAIQAGRESFFLMVITLFGTLVLGYAIGRLLKVDSIISFLIAGGTAICGGSAIAALAPVVRAKQSQISVALGVVFILNAIALFIFPYVGAFFQLTQYEFGLWCAIAIHDTSSVVGAAAKYGDEALGVATTVKLSRALWIVPVAFISSFIFKSKESKVEIPYFIVLFIVAIIANSYLPGVERISPIIVQLSKVGLTLTLFLIGTSLSSSLIKQTGGLPVLQGTVLWLVISVGTLIAILLF